MYLHELAAISSELQGCVFNKLNILDAEQGIWNQESLGLTNGEGFTAA